MLEFFETETFKAILPFIEAFALLILGYIAYKLLDKWLNQLLSKTKLDPMIFNFITHVVQIVVWVFVGIAILGKLGINSSSIVTIIAACGAAIALALQNSLSNLASGILVMTTQPFHKGDYISSANVSGTVESIDLLYTVIITDEIRKVTIPNSLLTSGTIINYTQDGARRYQILIGISYDTDIELARKVLIDLLLSDERTIKELAYGVDVAEYADSSIVLNVRSWVKSDEYFPYANGMNNKIKPTLDKFGISIPFPQIDVHMDK